MDWLWSPWRYQYVSHASGEPEGCIFCSKPEAGDDRKHLILYRGSLTYVILNLYPYTSGHLMVVPYAHLGSLEEAPDETVCEMMLMGKRALRALSREYRPRGFNVGMNLGECAGAGIAAHIHLHVLPRWPGDVNFMTAIGETRVMPEDLGATYERLSRAFADAGEC
jgi:ATP adenylyltransferase